jgi:chorismate mutase
MSAPTTAAPVVDAPRADADQVDAARAGAATRIGELRGEIDACDAAIIELVQRRLEISQEIGSLRAAAGGTRLSLSRESEVLNRFRLALGPDGAALGMMLLRQGRGRL